MDTKKLKLEDLRNYKGRIINEDEFIFEEHQKVELLLFLVVYLNIPGKIEDYYLVLGGRGLIPRHSFNRGDYLIQNARILLKTLNQKKVYLDELKTYETRREKDKNLYLQKDDKFVRAENISGEVEEREQLYLKLLSLEILHTASAGKYAFQDEKRYGIIIDDQPLEIKLPQRVRPTAMPKSKPKKGGKIKVLIKDLIEEAEFVDGILSG